MAHKFKPLASIAFTNWTQDQCKWIVATSKADDIARKVALYVLKKKYDHSIQSQQTSMQSA